MGVQTQTGAVQEQGIRLKFPLGIPAFEEETEFELLRPAETAPLLLLQSVRTASLCFLAVPVELVIPDYELALSPEDLAAAGFPPEQTPQPEDIELLTVLTVLREGVTANLLAPVVINKARRQAVQAVRSDTAYSHRHPVHLGDSGVYACS